MKRIRRTPRGNRCDKSQDSQGILLFVLKRGKIAISRQPLIPVRSIAWLNCYLLKMGIKITSIQMPEEYGIILLLVSYIMCPGHCIVKSSFCLLCGQGRIFCYNRSEILTVRPLKMYTGISSSKEYISASSSPSKT